MVKAIEGDEYDSESERTAKIGYSLQKIIDDIEKFFIIILISIVFDTTKEALVCMLVISLTRKFMGGMHMTTWFGCTMMTTMVYSLAIIGGKIFHFSLLMQSASILLCVLMVILYAPLPSEQRPKYIGKKRINIKIRCIAGLMVSVVLSVIMKSYSSTITCILLLEIIEAILVVCKKSILPDIKKGGEKNVW